MKVLVNLINKKVVGFNRKKQPFEIEIDMLDSKITKTFNNEEVSIEQEPGEFTLDDLIEIKGKFILSSTLKKYIMLDEELLEENIQTTLSTHSANTGYKFLQLHPNGQCRTTKIALPISTKNVQIYSEKDEGIEIEVGDNATNFAKLDDKNNVYFDNPTNSLYIKFKNLTNDPKEVYSYGIIL
jgi:hypothetical protein